VNWILVGIILSAFVILGSSRVATRIKAVAFQGALLSVLNIAVTASRFDAHSVILFLITFAIKTVAIPVLLLKACKVAKNPSRAEPPIGHHTALLVGGLIAVLSFSSQRIMPFAPSGAISPLIVPVALTTVLVGFLILVVKAKATNQVIGFLVLENGIFTFGMTIVSHFPMMVELGVLLDLLVGVFVMGIVILQISRTFDNIDTRTLTMLGDK